ncbi:tyrosine-type recombinase/integrase [Micromonospora sp. C81]|uniref:tyrosine-type recombinase/integrase n=1 Tax=Micromonospora sp. C81 TaxID=2824881 RepID=UPI001B35EA77|nr:tyrosine-type recombinase/integrase [Micromonospora sp. C81]MBQ1039301.1 tyrosine-type recombinase/integrase [Micromonospora sp. C81]
MLSHGNGATMHGHPDFATFAESWDLSLDADQYAANTRRAYLNGLRQLTAWLDTRHHGTGPLDVTRDQIRAWIVHVRDNASTGTARSWFAGVRHFFRWLVAEGETNRDPTDGIRTPPPNQPVTAILNLDQVRALLAACNGNDFTDRRDAAIMYAFLDCGLRLAEVAALNVEHVNLRDRTLVVHGKGSNRSGARVRQVVLSGKGARAFDRYLRDRRRHPHADRDTLWLGARGRPTLSTEGVEAVVHRRAAKAGIGAIHPHQLRHTWASEAKTAGLQEGDLMSLGGWRSRTMLDRYGKVAAQARATEAYRRVALGDRI